MDKFWADKKFWAAYEVKVERDARDADFEE